MRLVAAFLWNKSPRCSISTMLVDEDNVKILLPPKIHYLTNGYFKFRKDAKDIITNFFKEIIFLQKQHQAIIKIEYRIVFHSDIFYMIPAKESAFVLRIFLQHLVKLERQNPDIIVGMQLRNKLSGKALRHFKRRLRSMYLVSRKKDTGFEYHLWTVALHATKTNYEKKLNSIQEKLVNAVWSEAA